MPCEITSPKATVQRKFDLFYIFQTEFSPLASLVKDIQNVLSTCSIPQVVNAIVLRVSIYVENLLSRRAWSQICQCHKLVDRTTGRTVSEDDR